MQRPLQIERGMRVMAMFITMRIAGHLDSHWLDWFEGLDMRHLPDGNTELSGSVVDQTALHGMLNRARDLGLTLLRVSVESATKEDAGDNREEENEN
jgi:hypothetical protein